MDDIFIKIVILLATIVSTVIVGAFLIRDMAYNDTDSLTGTPLVGFSSSHDETRTNLNPAPVISNNGSSIAFIPSNTSKTINEYFVVFRSENDYFLLTYRDYDVWILAANSESITIQKQENGLGNTRFLYKDNLVKVKQISEDEADAYIKACSSEKAETE